MEDEPKKKKLSVTHQLFVDEYLKCWNGPDAYLFAFPKCKKRESARSAASRLLSDVNVQAEIQVRLAEVHMSSDEALAILANQARGSLGMFFKVVEEWTFYPLATYEILDAKEVTDDTDPDNPKVRTSYWVRHVAIDLDKVMDPQHSRLLRKFSDSPRAGMGIEIHDPQAAVDKVLRVSGKLKEAGLTVYNVTLTDGNE